MLKIILSFGESLISYQKIIIREKVFWPFLILALWYIDLKNISFHKIQKHIWKIIPEPITEFQVRFIFLQIDDMEMMDLAGT